MVPATTLAAFSGVALGMAISPGPNMMYLASRSVSQGRAAGLVSLGGIAVGFVIYLVLTAFGITALAMAVPLAYDALRLAGAAYLAWLAWQALRPGARSPFEVRDLPPDSRPRLFVMGLLTNLLNPKAAALYLSLLPQFVEPGRGSVLAQSLQLGLVQIAVSMTVNTTVILSAGTLAAFLGSRPTWARLQRHLMGTVLGGLAVRMALDGRR